MSNQEPQNQNKITEEAAVERRRRFIKGAAAATPVILTLVSPSVLGAQAECLSQQISGNASLNAPACQQGDGPAKWLSMSSWPGNFVRSTSGSCSGVNSTFLGGTHFNAANAFFGDSEARQMSEILCASPTSDEAVYVAAILNAETTGYVLDHGDVINLRKGTLQPPAPFTNAIQFLKSTFATL